MKAPGTGSSIIGSFNRGDSVKFTGHKTEKINGYEWAEVEYGGKTGWVAAKFLKIDKNLAVPQNTFLPDTENSMADEPTSGIRYVGFQNLPMCASPGIHNKAKAILDYGQSVEYTGNKQTVAGISWAEVKHGNKTGWVRADYLKTSRSGDMPFEIDLTDHDGLKNSFAGVKSSVSGEIGDYDGVYGLQCVDLSKWFIDNFTTLQSTSGNGKDQVNNLIKTNKIEDCVDKTIPCAPAIYSVAANKLGPGLSSMSSVTDYGHTGVILDVKRHYISEDPKKDKYTITYFHAWNGCNGYSSINTKDFYPSDDVTYLDLSNYMK